MAALTGQLLADFSDFTRAVDTATVSLKSFESGAGKVEGSLNRMVDNFSGRKVIQDAVLMAEAVEKIGGSSKLTDAELQKVGATAEAAAFKLRAMGQAVPPQIDALAKDFKNLDDSTKGATTSFSTLVGSFVTAEAITAGAEKALDTIIALVKELGQLALEGANVSSVAGNFQHLTDEAGRLGRTLLGALREGTHNTITDFELMKVANQDLAAGMGLSDAQFTTLAKGAFALAQATGTDVKQGLDTMNAALLTGQDRALKALTGQIDLKAAEDAYATSLGTTADRLTDDEKLYADRHAMIKAVETATARLGDQTDGLGEHVAQANTSWENFRLSLGQTLAESTTLEAGFTTLRTSLIEAFGGNQQALIDAIAAGVDHAAIVVTDFALAAVEGARVFNAAWSLVKTVVLGVETALVTMAAAATEAYARIAQGATYLPAASDETRRLAAEARTAADDMWALSKGLDEETKKAWEGVTGHSEFDQTLDKLGGVLLQTRDAMVAAAAATTTHTEATKGTTAASQGAALALGEEAASAGAARRALEDLAALKKQIAGIETDNRLKKEAGILGLDKLEQESSQKHLEAESRGIDQSMKAQAALNDFIHKQTLDSTSYQILKIWETADEQMKAYTGDEAHREAYNANIIRLAEEQANAIQYAAEASIDQVAAHGLEVVGQAASQLQSLVGGVKLPGSSQEQAFGTTYVVGPNGQRIALGPHGELPDNFFQQYSGQSSFSSGTSNQPRIGSGFEARAEGGSVSSGTPYLVGERGPELFVPSASGSIVPTGAAAAGPVIHVYVTQPLGTPAQIADVVGRAVMANLRGQGVRVPASV